MKRLRGGQRITLYQCEFCGDLSESSENHVHGDRAEGTVFRDPPVTHRPNRKVTLFVERTSRMKGIR